MSLKTLQDECQDKLDNMPEGLQEGDAGQLLQERIDQLSDVVSELECIDSFDSFKENAGYDIDSEEAESDEEYDERVLEQAKSNLSDAINDALSQLDY